jgi:uncharacterized caspase-like protein
MPAQSAAPQESHPHEVRIALVIGEGRYLNLPKLVNPEADARSIAEILTTMGYSTRLLLDANESDIRREVRRFASESSKAAVAVVFYAGHGAQLNGSNYLLPTDIDIPRTEADIQLTGLKADDLVNSVEANTKIVFLDACRDNPALFTKNLVKGRGGSPVGLAPSAASNFSPGKPGGGVFVAYATDAGAVAEDGKGPHSPFTEALLRYIQRRGSIDDMFSMVTREVRLVTKNNQRPYKYASLENIICLTGECSTDPMPATDDIGQQAIRTESDDLQIALQTKNVDALEAYLQKYPETSRLDNIHAETSRLARLEYNELTLFDVGNQHFPGYVKLSSIDRFGDRASVQTRLYMDPATDLGKKYPDARYMDGVVVIDCRQLQTASSEVSIIGDGGATLFHYKADPMYLDLKIGQAIVPGSLNDSLKNILCSENSRVPLFSKKGLSTLNLISVSSTVKGDGEFLFAPTEVTRSENERDVVIVFRMNQDTKYNLPAGVSFSGEPIYRTEVDRILLKCDQSRFTILQSEFYDAARKLVSLSVPDRSKVAEQPFLGQSPYAVLQRMVCKSAENRQ